MATFECIEGAPGQGKSLYTARLAKRLLSRNLKWYEKSGVIRPIFSNIVFKQDFKDKWGNFIQYWKNPSELCKLHDCDILWDEIATELDSRNFANLSDELKRFLSQYRKRGVDIYANTQDFSMVDARARLMITRVATLNKIIGSPDPSPTKPPVKKIWGLIAIRDVENFKETNPEKKQYGYIPTFFFIDREDIEIYDTRQAIDAGTLPVRRLRKQTEICDEDGYTRTKYV
jgi:hypothetical protein